ncbi:MULTISPECIES: thioredoxin-disulfide reductase [Methylosinus]|uniref:Thioredoxin reductase n=1 Tax=Methylosinus trichosporium (strain ATCC 35070 / NCIMB 11131 / UNIQEM 75 / OB3b) TaxID=595536 RepID=A0A2D2CZU4_METT3|nr:MULTISPECIES: thioredoxin-disulfide reductase [Methylosinus]ATQ68270.1 thioredoxin-disulfide reductase [Methylosinus trichosporium OB3b]OBS54446.1 thioredoxin-disulfide reductase [Methylosinus sp. 3S-1]
MSADDQGLHARVIVLGSGPAGYTAAIYTARAMLEPVVIAGFDQGGQLMITTDVENYPGFAEPIQGPWLMDQMRAQAEHVGAQLVSDHIVEARLGKRPFELLGDSGKLYTADALIIATGAKAKWLGVPSEEKFKGYGVSACATCDGFFFRGKKVLVVGGGNTAVEEALYLSQIAAEVTIMHRRDSFRAERVLQERLAAKPNVKILFDHAIDEILGDESPLSVTQTRVKNVKTGATQTLDVDGVFIAIGHQPASELFVGQLELKPSGYIVVQPGTTRTNIPGVFAAGDVADEIYRQAVTAAGLGCMAALDVERYLLDTPAPAGEALASEEPL